MANKMFRDKTDVTLISLVKQNPVLYDYNNPKYMDFNAREVTWQKIGDELKRPAVDCKIRWINIRDVHRRLWKKRLSDPNRSSKPYKYESQMAFMKAFYKDVAIPLDSGDCDYEEKDYDEWDNESGQEQQENNSDSSDEPIKKVARRRKSKRKQEKSSDEEKPTTSNFGDTGATPELDPADPVDAFLISIASTLKTFSPYHLNLAKSKIFAVVQEHDLEQIMQKQPKDVKVSSHDNMFLNE